MEEVETFYGTRTPGFKLHQFVTVSFNLLRRCKSRDKIRLNQKRQDLKKARLRREDI